MALTSELGKQIKLKEVEGTLLQSATVDNWSQIQSFEAKPDDLLICTYPKAGDCRAGGTAKTCWASTGLSLKLEFPLIGTCSFLLFHSGVQSSGLMQDAWYPWGFPGKLLCSAMHWSWVGGALPVLLHSLQRSKSIPHGLPSLMANRILTRGEADANTKLYIPFVYSGLFREDCLTGFSFSPFLSEPQGQHGFRKLWIWLNRMGTWRSASEPSSNTAILSLSGLGHPNLLVRAPPSFFLPTFFHSLFCFPLSFLTFVFSPLSLSPPHPSSSLSPSLSPNSSLSLSLSFSLSYVSSFYLPLILCLHII